MRILHSYIKVAIPIMLVMGMFSTLYAAERDFAKVYTNNIKGNIKVIGNTVLTDPTGNTNNSNNHALPLAYVNIDTSNPNGRTIFNSSRATILSQDSNKLDISHAKVIKATLYWQGHLHIGDSSENPDTVFSAFAGGSPGVFLTAHTEFNPYIKVNEGEYKAVTGISYDDDGGKYAAHADVTAILQENLPQASPVALYTVANIAARTGTERTGLGNYGAWTLVIVYENLQETQEKTRNINIYDGYKVISVQNNPKINIKFSGFRTPKLAKGGVDSTLSIFVGEGDTYIKGDTLSFTNEKKEMINLKSTSNHDRNFFNSAIEGVENREPKITNNQGIDIHTRQVGTKKTGNKKGLIGTNQSTAELDFSTTGDTYMPSMVAFVTELFVPKFCYDYDIRIRDYIGLDSESLKIDAKKLKNKELGISVLLRSEISDFDIINTKYNLTFTKLDIDNSIQYLKDQSKVSSSDRNTYLSISDLSDANISDQIGIGRGSKAQLESKGGTIGSFESTYVYQKFKIGRKGYKGKFDITLRGEISFDPEADPVPFVLSTDTQAEGASLLSRCTINPTYNPILANFNIERVDSGSYNAKTQEELRYPLYTQIAGRPFTVSIVSYADDANGLYNTEADSLTSVEVEIIDASVFNNSSEENYDSTCENPGGVYEQNIGVFKNFDGKPRIDNLQVPNDFNKKSFINDIAIQNAAFRLWVLSIREVNGTKRIISHNCDLDKNGCFQDIYETQIKIADIEKRCENKCAKGTDNTECYLCLKENFATPICSRDNFSIRPEAFSIRILDQNGTTGGSLLANNLEKNKFSDDMLRYAAGYPYTIEVDATLFNTIEPVRKYHNNAFQASTVDLNNNPSSNPLGNEKDHNIMAALKFVNGGTCVNNIHHTFAFNIEDSVLAQKTTISSPQVGAYEFFMLDSNWTNVDRQEYAFKTRFGACSRKNNNAAVCSDCDYTQPGLSSPPGNTKIGCVINSNGTKGINDYNAIEMRFAPYSFRMRDINESFEDKPYLYMHTMTSDDNPVDLHFAGAISAINLEGNTTANFDAACDANDVNFTLEKDLSIGQEILDEKQIMVARNASEYTGRPTEEKKRISFQVRYANATDNNKSLNVKILQNDFSEGNSTIAGSYNFKRFIDYPSNPITVSFKAQYAQANDIKLAINETLDNNLSARQVNSPLNFDFYYACLVYDQFDRDYVADFPNTSVAINMIVQTYCDEDNGACANTYLEGNGSNGQRKNNYIHNLNHPSNYGQIQNITPVKTPNILTITPNVTAGIENLYNDEDKTIFNVSVQAGTERPYETRINFRADSWLQCSDKRTHTSGQDSNISGVTNPNIIIEGPAGGWIGTGNTGSVVETNASNNNGKRRVDW